MHTDKHVLPPIPFVYCFGLQNLRRHMSCKEIKKKNVVGGATKVDKERYSTPALGGKIRGGAMLQMDDVTNIFQSYCVYERCLEIPFF